MTNWEHMKGGQWQYSSSLVHVLMDADVPDSVHGACVSSPLLSFQRPYFRLPAIYGFSTLSLSFCKASIQHIWLDPRKGKSTTQICIKNTTTTFLVAAPLLVQMHIPKLLSQPPTFCASHYFLRQKRRTCC